MMHKAYALYMVFELIKYTVTIHNSLLKGLISCI
jgi:hypothetical protein